MAVKNPYRKYFLKNTGLSIGYCLLVPGLFTNGNTTDKPNIVLVMADNLGYGDFGLGGNEKVRTPNIDRFASEGMQFTRFYANPMSAPTRASIMTGRSHYRTGVIHTSRGGAKMHGDEITVAEYLREAGYTTGMFGKWHLGDNYPMRPYDQGFAETLWHKSGRIGQVPDTPNTYINPMLWKNDQIVKTEGYCTDVFTDATLKFIEENKNRPFFVYLATNAGHTANEKVVGPLVPARYSDPYKKMGFSDITSKVYGMVTNLDENFGRIIEKIEELNLRENTIIIFTTDDGPGQDYNAGFRAGSVYESKMRVPFAIQWPKGLQKSPRLIDRIGSHIDILPTLLDVCGLKIPADPVIEGVSLLPLLTGQNITWKDRLFFFQCHRGLEPRIYRNCAVVGQRYKMVGYPDTFDNMVKTAQAEPLLELYDLIEDPGEKNNIAGKHPEILESYRKAYEKWFEEVKATRQFEPGLIHIGSEYEITTHLCRYQDASYYNEDPSGWPVVIEKGGKYYISINRGLSKGQGSLHVKIDDRQMTRTLNEGENRAVFRLPEGKFQLNIWCQEEGDPPYLPRRVEDTIGDADITRK